MNKRLFFFMGNMNVKNDLYGCDDEEFRWLLLSKYIDEPDYNNYKIMLKDKIEREMRRFRYVCAKKYGDEIINGELENVRYRSGIKEEFKGTVKWYAEFKKGFIPYHELGIKDRFVQWFENIRLNWMN